MSLLVLSSMVAVYASASPATDGSTDPDSEHRTYEVVLYHNPKIVWTVDGEDVDSGSVVKYEGAIITVNVRAVSDHVGTPALTANGRPYEAGTEFRVAEDTVFAVLLSAAPEQYKVTLSYNEGVRWNVNGTTYGNSGTLTFGSGYQVTVRADMLPGYTGTLTFTVDGSSYTSGTEITVTKDIVFAAYGPVKIVDQKFRVTLPDTEGYDVTATSGSYSPVTSGSSFSFTIVPYDGYSAEDVTALANGVPVISFEGVYTIRNITSDQNITLSPAPVKRTVTVMIDSDYESVVFYYAVGTGVSKQYRAPFRVDSGSELKLTAIPPDGTSVVWPSGSSSLEYVIKDVSEDTKVVVNHASSPDKGSEDSENEGSSEPISTVQAVLVAIGTVISVVALIQLRARRA
ncbi:MAG: hypothetical protein LBV63_05145 [Candidatus Methanoplasma sp.]|nr:hypothetical protein [Candidatus Methanoplasma sp.]